MRLYAGHSVEFIQLNRNNQIAGLLKKEFFSRIGYNPSNNEVMSWRNSLLRVALLLEDGALRDLGVFVEHQLPQSSRRTDVKICGYYQQGQRNTVLIELKQREHCTLFDYDSEIMKLADYKILLGYRSCKTMTDESPAGNRTYPQGRVLTSKDSFVVNQTLVFQIKFWSESPALRIAAKR